MKNKNVKSITSFCFIMSAFIIAGSGCGGGAENSSFALPTVGNGGGTPGDGGVEGTSDGIDNPTHFYVGIKRESTSIAHVRSAAAFDAKCSISPTSGMTDLTCYVDVPEGDVFVKGITFQYNVPAGMCRYLRRTPYWYYNKEVGVGPSSVSLAITKNASGDTTNYECSVDGSAFTNACNSFREVSVNQKTNTPVCVYDTTGSEDGANCCFGNYTLTTTTTTGANPAVVDTLKAKWGGDTKSCIGGPGITNWSLFSKYGIPAPSIESASAGIMGEFAVTAPILTTGIKSNIAISNFYTPAFHSHTGFVLPRLTTKPFYVDPVDDRSGSPISTSNYSANNFLIPGEDSYMYECLNETYEVKNRIKLYVREWDTYPDYLNYISSAGVVAVPDRTGSEPGACVGIEGPCDDFTGPDDFVGSFGNSYDVSPGGYIHRNDYFPFFD